LRAAASEQKIFYPLRPDCSRAYLNPTAILADAKDVFEFLKSKRRRAEDRACKAYQLALNFTTAVELLEPLFSVPTDDKGQLAYNLFLYGALDAACQAMQVPDQLFLAFVEQFFVFRGRTPQYAQVLMDLSQDQGANKSAFLAMIEGGRVFQDWVKGNAMAPASVILRLETYTDDPAFPATPGHLAVTLIDRRSKVA